jgi:hypothetical protein
MKSDTSCIGEEDYLNGGNILKNDFPSFCPYRTVLTYLSLAPLIIEAKKETRHL